MTGPRFSHQTLIISPGEVYMAYSPSLLDCVTLRAFLHFIIFTICQVALPALPYSITEENRAISKAALLQ